MKNTFVRISILALGAVAAYAQNVNSVSAYVPFDFSVSGTILPAGTYRVALEPTLLMLHAKDARANAVVPTQIVQEVSSQDTAQLVFHRLGGQYFLAEVHSPGTYARKIPVTRQERNLARRGGPDKTPDRVVIAAR